MRSTRSLYAHGCWVSIARPSRLAGCFQSAKWYNASPASRARVARYIMAHKQQAVWLNGIQLHEVQNRKETSHAR